MHNAAGQIRCFELWHFCLPLIPARHQSKQKSQEPEKIYKTNIMTVKIIFRSNYSEGNDFWYFKEEFKNQLYSVVESEDAEKYLVTSDEKPKRYISKVDCQIVKED